MKVNPVKFVGWVKPNNNKIKLCFYIKNPQIFCSFFSNRLLFHSRLDYGIIKNYGVINRRPVNSERPRHKSHLFRMIADISLDMSAIYSLTGHFICTFFQDIWSEGFNVIASAKARCNPAFTNLIRSEVG